MSHLKYYNYKGFGDYAKENIGYSQAVRVGDLIKISGQGGWDPMTGIVADSSLDAEMSQAFENVALTLKTAGGTGWDQVFSVRAFVTQLDERSMELFVKYMRKHCPNHQPINTAVGVAKLALTGMRIEIEVDAHVPN